MNKDYVLYNLIEAKEELDRTIQELQLELEYGDPEFSVAMQHLYHHLNTAWNARNATVERTNECSDSDYKAWRKFPTDIDMN
jgi:hypothetical protein